MRSERATTGTACTCPTVRLPRSGVTNMGRIIPCGESLSWTLQYMQSPPGLYTEKNGSTPFIVSPQGRLDNMVNA